mgnify:CR=1 FL=1
MYDPVLAHAKKNEPKLIEFIKKLVACASIGVDPKMAKGMEDVRILIEEILETIGFQNCQRLLPANGSGQPAIYADRLDAPEKPTILVYAHYDVQPAEPLEKWNFHPFKPIIQNKRIYGRGVSDDKGPMMIALGALDAFVKIEGRLPLNVKILIEGEEETGSPSLGKIFEYHRALLASDAVLSADGARWRPDLQTINIGSRGNAGFEIRLQTASQDLHSGRFGGIVANPLHLLSGLIAGLHDKNGRVIVPGFYDGIEEPSENERAEISTIPFHEASFFEAIKAVPRGESGYSTLERLWLRPTIDVNGMWGGYTGAGSKTVIPSEAFAKLTMRLVQGQKPAVVQKAVIDHLNNQLSSEASLEISEKPNMFSAYTVPLNHPLLSAACTALKKTSGVDPLKVRIGASLPLTEIVRKTLGIDTIMFSFSIADENFHAPNEYFRLESIREGLSAWIQIFREIEKMKPDDFKPFCSK